MGRDAAARSSPTSSRPPAFEAPAWSLRQPLSDPWMPEHPFLTPDRVRAQTPDWLRRQNIHVPARDLVTA